MARRNIIAGVDIGRYAAKVAWVRTRGNQSVITAAEMLRFPAGTADPRPLLAPWFEKIGLKGAPCVIGLSGGQCMFQPLTLPPGDQRSLDQVAAMEIVQFNEMTSESMVYGVAPVPSLEGERRMLLAMARPSLLQDVLDMAGGAGLDVIDLVPAPAAMFEMARRTTLPDDDTVSLVVGIGSAATEVALGSRRGLLFARTFSIGGQMFTDALAKARGISGGQAEGLKTSQGSLKADFEGHEALQNVANMWVAELQSCLAVFRGVFPAPDQQPVRILLCGGASALPGFVPHIHARLNLEASVIGALPSAARLEHVESFVTAAGLAVAGTGTPALSLLPPRVRNELMFKEQKPLWIGAGVAAALILAVSLVGGYRDFQSKTRQLNAQKVSLKRRQQLVAEIEDVKSENLYIHELAQPVREIVEESSRMRRLLDLVGRSKDPDDWISMICDATSYFQWRELRFPDKKPEREVRDTRKSVKPKPAAAAPPEENPFDRVMIVGNTRRQNLYTVRELIARLEASELVASADLLSDDKLVAGGEEPEADETAADVRNFVIDVRMARP